MISGEFLNLLETINIVKLASLEFGKTGLLGRTLCGMDRSVSQVLYSLVQDMAGFIMTLHQVKKT